MANVFKLGNEVGKTQVNLQTLGHPSIPKSCKGPKNETCNSLTSILINPKHEDVHCSNFSNLTQEDLVKSKVLHFLLFMNL